MDPLASCNGSKYIQMFSEFCLQHPEESQCFPQQMRDSSVFAGIWCIVNAILGFCGNLLTIFAIPYAARRQKFNLHRNWPLTIFILNLAIADFLYSSINLPLYALQYLNKGWLWGECHYEKMLNLQNSTQK